LLDLPELRIIDAAMKTPISAALIRITAAAAVTPFRSLRLKQRGAYEL